MKTFSCNKTVYVWDNPQSHYGLHLHLKTKQWHKWQNVLTHWAKHFYFVQNFSKEKRMVQNPNYSITFTFFYVFDLKCVGCFIRKLFNETILFEEKILLCWEEDQPFRADFLPFESMYEGQLGHHMNQKGT